MVGIAVDTIQTELLDEAIASPQLLADVAQVEGYISETYSNRSFVELLQKTRFRFRAGERARTWSPKSSEARVTR